MTPRDNCDGCGQDYNFERSKDTLHLFIASPECNHVQAVCPHCGVSTRIFLTPDAVIHVLSMEGAPLPMSVNQEAPDKLRQSARELWGEEDAMFRRYPQPKKNEPREQAAIHIPREWLRELHDTLRDFGGKCSQDCDHVKVSP